jgi:DNA primase
MSINFEKFVEWCESKFPGDVVTVGDSIIRINTCFQTSSGRRDREHSLHCDTKGGKKQISNGCYHCWSSGKTGTIIGLLMEIEKCSFEEACFILGSENNDIRDLEKEIEKLFIKPPEPVIVEEKKPEFLNLPPFTYPINEIPTSSRYRIEAETYLNKRKLSTDGLLISTNGRYRQRIVIPYYNNDGRLIYYNGRYIGDNDKVPKYLGPQITVGLGKGDVLFFPSAMIEEGTWPKEGAKLFLTEGEFDAISIYYAGEFKTYSAAFGGKNISDKQLEFLQPYQIVLCLDSDSAGKEGIKNMIEKMQARGMKISFVRPPQIYKDWNAMLVNVGPKLLIHYLEVSEKPVTDEYLLQLAM